MWQGAVAVGFHAGKDHVEYFPANYLTLQTQGEKSFQPPDLEKMQFPTDWKTFGKYKLSWS